MISQIRDIGGLAGAEIVDHVHRMALGQQEFNEMRADEPGATSHKSMHNSIHR